MDPMWISMILLINCFLFFAEWRHQVISNVANHSCESWRLFVQNLVMRTIPLTTCLCHLRGFTRQLFRGMRSELPCCALFLPTSSPDPKGQIVRRLERQSCVQRATRRTEWARMWDWTCGAHKRQLAAERENTRTRDNFDVFARRLQSATTSCPRRHWTLRNSNIRSCTAHFVSSSSAHVRVTHTSSRGRHSVEWSTETLQYSLHNFTLLNTQRSHRKMHNLEESGQPDLSWLVVECPSNWTEPQGLNPGSYQTPRGTIVPPLFRKPWSFLPQSLIQPNRIAGRHVRSPWFPLGRVFTRGESTSQILHVDPLTSVRGRLRTSLAQISFDPPRPCLPRNVSRTEELVLQKQCACLFGEERWTFLCFRVVRLVDSVHWLLTTPALSSMFQFLILLAAHACCKYLLFSGSNCSQVVKYTKCNFASNFWNSRK